MTAPLAFVDTETTGLDPHRHEIWEVGLILRDAEGAETEYEWQLPVHLAAADPMALNIGRFHDRRLPAGEVTDHPTFAGDFARITRGAHLVGAVVSFDERRLWDYLRAHNECPMWHYHIIDVEALAVGFLAGIRNAARPDVVLAPDPAPPWKSDDLSIALGIDLAQFDRHTALGDARWARAIYDAVIPRA